MPKNSFNYLKFYKMRFDRFRAKILDVRQPPVTGVTEFLNPNRKDVDTVFEFSKNRIFFNQEQKDGNLSLEPPSQIHSTSVFKHGMKYTFDKVYDDNDNLRFQISVGNTPYNSFLKINKYNRLICNIIHGRYLMSCPEIG